MRILACFATMLLVVLAAPHPAAAWGWDGHRIICAIAWDLVSPATQDKIGNVMEAQGKEAFVEGCLWPDDVRPWRPETGPHHFINLPRGAAAIDLARDCALPKSCVVAEIGAQGMTMRRYHARDALRYLAHFVGDLHQPLHVSYADDAGGTLIKGKFMGQDTNLHLVWDFGMLDAAGRSWQETAADLERRITPAERYAWQAGTPLDWATETYAITTSPAVGYHAYDPAFDLGRIYLDANLPTVYRQLERAAVRLAELLENYLQ